MRHIVEAATRVLVFVVLFVVSLCFIRDAHAETDGERLRVLIVVESDSRLPLGKILISGIEAEFGPDLIARSEIYVEYLDLLRFNDPAELQLNRALLLERYKGLGFDAVGVLGNNALAFVIDNRDDLSPGAPIVYGGLGDEGLKTALAGRKPPAMSGVISYLDLPGTLDLALTVQPNAPEILVIAGSANIDRQWRSTVSSTLGNSYRNIPVRLLPEATADDYLAEARSLDPGGIVLLLSVNLDTAERRFLPVQFAEALAETSAAPVWTPYETQIGKGVIGGRVEELTVTGKEIGKMLLMAIAGVPLPDPVRVSSAPAVDWRAMKRHNLDLSMLPEDSRILFYEPTQWEQHRNLLLTIGAIVAAQTATIVALMFLRRHNLRTQASLDSEREQLIHVSRNLRLGQLSASLAHEINQPLAAIQANAEAGARIAGRSSPDLEEIGTIFRDINDDVRRAASTIASLRRLMVKGEVAMGRLDLNEIVRATLSLAKNELATSGAKVRQDLASDPVELNGNAVQLQQIVLNLVLNASEAMEGLPAAARIVHVTTSPLPCGGATLMVEDAGPGVPPDQREEAFRPFVSGKPSGLGVGLAICRSIAQAHGGSLAFADPAGRGARVVLTLPAAVASS